MNLTFTATFAKRIQVKYPTFLLIMFVICSCNNKSGQVTNTSNEPAHVITDSIGQDTGNSYDPSNLKVNTTQQSVNSSADPAQIIADSSIQTNSTSEDPAHILVKDPLEGLDTTSKRNPPHGQPGHRCDVPVGADISAMPKKIGMSLCK